MTNDENKQSEEIKALPIRKTVHIAWRGIRIRIWRSMLVVSGIVLAIAFLTYILCANSFTSNITERGSTQLVNRLVKAGTLNPDDIKDQHVQMLWTVGLALLISFVGIVNAMLMSVTERFREIGTMKCLGALDSFVLKLFLIESLFEGVAGAAAGILLGLAFAFMEGMTLYGIETWSLISLPHLGGVMIGCFTAGLILTVLGAIYPAYCAAKMMPVVALRSEV